MGSLLHSLLLIFIILSVPFVIFLLARTVGEWIVGFLLLFVMIFYYANPLQKIIPKSSLTNWFIHFLGSYHSFVLSHWPHFTGIRIFGLHILQMSVNYNFSPTFLPIILLWIGGIVRLVVVWHVPHERLREVTREYWLYIISFLIILLIISSILNWNFFVAFIFFIIILFFIATGLYSIFNDFFSLVIYTIRHVARWVWIGLQHVAGVAADIARFLHHILDYIRELYHKYIQQPFQRLNTWLETIEDKEEVKIQDTLKRKRL